MKYAVTHGTYLGINVVRKAFKEEGRDEHYHYFLYKDEELVGNSKKPYTTKIDLFKAISSNVESLVGSEWWDKSVIN